MLNYYMIHNIDFDQVDINIYAAIHPIYSNMHGSDESTEGFLVMAQIILIVPYEPLLGCHDHTSKKGK